MKSINLVLFFLFFSTMLFSQENVGINKTNPNQSLDVDGNVNIDGNLMLNGQAGQPGQVLKTNSSGATQWVDFSQFENVRSFYVSGSGTWQVPAGVTKIAVELQGGGGAASTKGGGSGGNYVTFTSDVQSLSTISIFVGKGGNHSTSEVNGEASTVIISGITFTANGGLRGSTISERGGSNFLELGNKNYFVALGQPGTANDYSFTYGPGGNTIFKTVYGSGGGVYPFYRYTPGGSRLKNENSGDETHITESTYPFSYGCGGAAEKVLGLENNGERGYVKIYY